ncbi:MAG: ATP-binding protein [Bryobacterales bacterium]|nr:ATP-binding protein [Bryobacterales bacterium]
MRETRLQFSTALLVVATMAAVVAALVNFQQQARFRLPEDGVVWVERQGQLRALHVKPDGPGHRAGIKPGDVLKRINGAPVERVEDVTRILIGLGAWKRVTYSIERRDVLLQIPLITGEARPTAALYVQYLIGAGWLAIGLFVLFRRAGAPKALHFYGLCLATFVLLTFHYTGKLNNFDKAVYLGNVAAGLLAPALFLHFCLSFPEPRRWTRGWRALWIYVVPLAMMALWLGLSSGTLRVGLPLNEAGWLLDRIWLGLATASWLAGGVVLARARSQSSDPVARQQLKWLRNGALLGFGPFAVLYAVPYVFGALPGESAKLTVTTLILVPLTWAWAILRYRLMDVDVIFRQGYVYTLATLCVLGLFFSLIFSIGRFEDLEPAPAAVLLLLAAFVFQPIRNWIEQLLDRHVFYRERYDYRRTLADFARELGAELDPDSLLERVASRLRRTLSVERVAFFLPDQAGVFQLERIYGPDGASLRPSGPLDLSFLQDPPGKPFLFFERTGRSLELLDRQYPATVRRTLAELDLTYYVPCEAHGRVVAYLGLSRSDTGDFLTSEDLDLVVMVAGYLAIALENARLYRSLELKAAEYERLKEYSENIVASIRVGVVAVDLEGRVEGWNPEMERLTGLGREEALGRRFSELFPSELVEQLEEKPEAGPAGVRQLYQFPLRVPGRKVIEMPAPAGPGRQEARREPPRGEVLVNVAATPLVGREGQRIGRVILFDDVTERSELERRLAQAEKLSSIGLLAAGVAHEVNTPLAVISTYAQMLARQVAGDEEKARLLEKITRQTFRASEIVNALLNFSRAAPGRFEELDLNRLVRETLLLLEHQLQQAGIRVELEMEEGLALIHGDAGKLQQVFLNLFLNARDAMEGGGTLRIRSSSDGRWIRVEVRDNGPGIPAEHLHRVFDPFFTTKPPRRGTGLGLSISYGIVREHGGEIEVESRPGEGACFRLAFPVARKALHA